MTESNHHRRTPFWRRLLLAGDERELTGRHAGDGGFEVDDVHGHMAETLYGPMHVGAEWHGEMAGHSSAPEDIS